MVSRGANPAEFVNGSRTNVQRPLSAPMSGNRRGFRSYLKMREVAVEELGLEKAAGVRTA